MECLDRMNPIIPLAPLMPIGASGGGAGFAATNFCWTPLELISGTTYGGTTFPAYTAGGILIYSAQFDTATGIFIFKMGDDGTKKLANSSLLILQYKGRNEVELIWDDVNLYYTGISIELANALALEVGNEVCVTFYASPENFLLLDLVTEALNE